MPTVEENGKVVLKGFSGYMLGLLQSGLGFKYEVHMDKDNDWGTIQPDGTWRGQVGMVSRNECDLTMGPMVLTTDRCNAMDPMPSYYYGRAGHIAGRRRLYDSDIFGYLQCFAWQRLTATAVDDAAVSDYVDVDKDDDACAAMTDDGVIAAVTFDHVWVGVFVSILVTSGVFTIISKKKRGAFLGRYVDQLFYLSAMFFWEANTVPSARRGNNRLLLGTWWMAVILLGLAFTGFMKASMTVKKELPRMESVEDLAKNPNIVPLITKGMAFDVFLKENKNPAYQALWKRVVNHRSIVPQKEVFVRKVMEEVLDGKKAIFSTVAIFVYWTQKLYQDTPPQGEFYFGQVRIARAYGSMFVNKGLPQHVKKIIHTRQRWILEGGFAYLYSKNVLEKGLHGQGATYDRVRPLGIDDVSGLFAVLAIGAIAASLAAIGECLYTRHTTTRVRCMQRRWMHESRKKVEGRRTVISIDGAMWEHGLRRETVSPR
ncbi:glutamate receptor 2-like [Ornithodoros turicata]|uniref:glutamate receptor 2-like n=1 Tax=Ornithodoros turicata TaxID=34597 RepID=UPI003139BDDA